jgi:epoxyqueuosine reductase QueG
MRLKRLAEERELLDRQLREHLRLVERTRDAIRRVVVRASFEECKTAVERSRRLDDARADLTPPLRRRRRRDLLRERGQRLGVVRQIFDLLVDRFVAIGRVAMFEDQRVAEAAGLGIFGDRRAVIQRAAAEVSFSSTSARACR